MPDRRPDPEGPIQKGSAFDVLLSKVASPLYVTVTLFCDVVGESLSTGETQLQTAGYGISVHPWGGSCATANAISQQVPPQDDNVQTFYCAARPHAPVARRASPGQTARPSSK